MSWEITSLVILPGLANVFENDFVPLMRAPIIGYCARLAGRFPVSKGKSDLKSLEKFLVQFVFTFADEGGYMGRYNMT